MTERGVASTPIAWRATHCLSKPLRSNPFIPQFRTLRHRGPARENSCCKPSVAAPIKAIPPRTDVTFEKKKPELIKELTDRQMDQEVPKMFAQLNEEAKPLFILTPKDETRAESEERSKKLGADPRAFEKK